MVCFHSRYFKDASLLSLRVPVGLSRQHTAENRRPRTKDTDTSALHTQHTVTNGDPYGLDPQKTITNGRLFTEEELSNAMSQSTLKASRRERS